MNFYINAKFKNIFIKGYTTNLRNNSLLCFVEIKAEKRGTIIEIDSFEHSPIKYLFILDRAYDDYYNRLWG